MTQGGKQKVMEKATMGGKEQAIAINNKLLELK